MSDDFDYGLFSDDDSEDRREANDFNIPDHLEPLWLDAVDHSRHWDDYDDRTREWLADRFEEQFSIGGSRDGMYEWLDYMGIQDYEFDWEAWREANGY